MTLTEGAWSKRPAYLIGGGPSLKGFDWSLLKGKNTICVNRSFIDVPDGKIFFTEDLRVIEKYADKLNDWPGLKIYHALAPNFIEPAFDAVPDLLIFERKRPDKYWSTSFADGLALSSNSMIGALNIASILDADPIYLLGVDCRSDGNYLSHYHSDYLEAGWDWAVGSNITENFKSDFENWAALHLRDRRVVNLVNPDFESALECWPKCSLKSAFTGLTTTTTL